jgi:DNA polymerase (family X)
VDDGSVVASATEEEIFAKLGLAFVPPELRENRGEVEAAEKGPLPKLIEANDVRADLHVHTTSSDGRSSAQEMVDKAARLGHRLVGISDHGAGLTVAQGLDAKGFAAQRKELSRLQLGQPKLRILQGAELDIKKDGTLDLDAAARAELDYVIGSVHSAFTLDSKQQTARIVKAVESGIDILGHPTGRLLGQRPSIEFDLEAVAQACKDQDVLLEINASRPRLDLWAERISVAKAVGCRFAIASDAHTLEGLEVLGLGVTQARRAGLLAKDVATTKSPDAILRHLGHAKRR